MGQAITINNVKLYCVPGMSLEVRLDQVRNSMQLTREKLIALVANTSPVYHSPEGDESIVDYALREVPELLEYFEQLAFEDHLLVHAIEYPEDVVKPAEPEYNFMVSGNKPTP